MFSEYERVNNLLQSNLFSKSLSDRLKFVTYQKEDNSIMLGSENQILKSSSTNEITIVLTEITK